MDRSRESGADERPLLLVVSTGPRDYREYLFAAMHTRYRIHLINTVEPTWERPYLVGSSLVATTDVELVSRAAAEVAAREPVHGVLSWDEARVHQTAIVVEANSVCRPAPPRRSGAAATSTRAVPRWRRPDCRSPPSRWWAPPRRRPPPRPGSATR